MSEQEPKFPFNPNEHLMQIKSGYGDNEKSSDYLPVQWRLVWFRSKFPQGSIETECIHIDLEAEFEEEVWKWNKQKRMSEKILKRAKGIAIFHAIIKDGIGGVAHGTKMEKAVSFDDFLEKAETGSIGRALAALGYGTQFTGDEFNEHVRIVDSPVEREAQEQPSSSPHGQKPNPKPTPTPAKATVAQAPAKVDTPQAQPQQQAPTPITKETLAQQKAKVDLFKKYSNSDEWSAFCTFAKLHTDHLGWSPESFERASSTLDQYAITPSMKAKIKDAHQNHDIGTIQALGCPATNTDIDALTAISAAKILMKFQRYTIIDELAKVFDWGKTENTHYGRLKALGANDGVPLDTPLSLFILGVETKKGGQGEKYVEMLKDQVRKHPEGIKKLPEAFQKEHGALLESIIKKPAA